MELNELYIAPDAEILSFRAAERLAWEEFGGEDGISTGNGGENSGEEEEL